MSDKPYATYEEFIKITLEFKESKPESFPFMVEWAMAMSCGWDPAEFEQYYRDYVKSTQVKLKRGDDPTALKGRPLENVVSYFLEKGGLINGIKPISESGKWQVDGHGPINRTSILLCWGEEKLRQMGIQVYMEAKNHTKPATNDEFSEHCRRMDEHDCNVGVMISTSGYRIGRGLGIADSIYIQSVKNKFHILLVFQSLRAVYTENKAPLAVLTQALMYAVNNSYGNDGDVQRNYSEIACHEAALSEHVRLFG